MRRFSLAILVALAAGPATAALEPLSFEELSELLRADLPEPVLLSILSEIEPPELSAGQWLALRDLGASDSTLLALLPSDLRPGPDPSAPPQPARPGRPEPARADPPAPEPERADPPAPEPERADPPVPGPAGADPAAPEPAPAAAPAGSSGQPEYRAFYDDDPEVGRVFVLTNLDEEGRRLGGRSSAPVRRNLVAGRSAEEARAEQQARRQAEERARAAAPAPPPPAAPQPAYDAPVALLPETLSRPAAFVQTSPYLGFFYRYPTSHLYPPGSYTHYKLFHQGGRRGLSHYQLPAGQVFYGPPFPAAGHHRPHRGR